MKQQRKCSQKFTLIELLIVIAVVAILASMLLPALSTARQVAKRITCLANIRGIFQGALMYVSDADGYLPRAGNNAEYVGYVNDYLKQRYDAAHSDGIRMWKEQKGIFFCPGASDPPQASPCWTGGSNTVSYYASSYMQSCTNSTDLKSGCWTNSDGTNMIVFRKLDFVKDGCVMMADRNWNSIADDRYACNVVRGGFSNLSNATSPYGWYAPGWNHSLSSNMAFKDGHVQAYKYNGHLLFNDDFIPQ